ncbi:hypothetical protein [Gulosibacter sp. 10]|uniref:hypothetical protein n=1 Tax=Gulosibacter sp. 10 TaxID=1255570 RepID=UPI00097ED425|nr:hypothetical protein [Gulosibacter sp. 10]SJM48950.1 hypothetical protein FM112_00790 [Gulosibacter sp. 10]
MIGFYLHHHGSGHRIRGTLIARRLGVPVVGFGTGEAPQGWPGMWVPLAADDADVRPERADVAAGGALHWAPLHHPGLLERHAAMAAALQRLRPRLVLVDVSVEAAVLCRLLGIPVAVMLLPGERDDAPHRLAHGIAELLLAARPVEADAPRGPRPWDSKTIHVGAISRFAGRAPAADRAVDRRRVLVLGGTGGGGPAPREIEAAAEATPDWEWLQRGGTGGFVGPERLWSELSGADAVIVSAGENAVADVAAARRPAVVIPVPRPFDEQLATARALARLDLAETPDSWPEPAQWPGLLAAALRRGGDGWDRWEGDGVDGAAAALLSVYRRHGGEA